MIPMNVAEPLIRRAKTDPMDKCMVCSKMARLLYPCKTCVLIVCSGCLTGSKKWGEGRCTECVKRSKPDVAASI